MFDDGFLVEKWVCLFLWVPFSGLVYRETKLSFGGGSSKKQQTQVGGS